MDLDDFRSFILDSGLDVWTWIDMAISVASADHENELKNRRDAIIERLYSPAFSKCQNCDQRFVKGNQENGNYREKQDVGCDYNSEKLQSGQMVDGNEEEGEDGDDEQKKILEIKSLLNDPNQTERCLIDLLQRLEDMDITFKALKETDIGRHVTRLRKHSSSEIRRLVKILVRKWKDIVDEWVRTNNPMEEVAQFNGDKDSPQEAQHKDNKIQNDMKDEVIPQGEGENGHFSYYLTSQKGKVEDNKIESKNMSSATKRFNGNQEAQNYAKKQRTAQAMEFHHIPERKKAIFTNKAGSTTVPVKYW